MECIIYNLIVIVIIAIFLHFKYQMPTSGIIFIFILWMVGLFIAWHIALFTLHDIELAKKIIILNIFVIGINIIYHMYFFPNKKTYIATLVILAIWESCLAIVTFNLTPRQVLKLS